MLNKEIVEGLANVRWLMTGGLFFFMSLAVFPTMGAAPVEGQSAGFLSAHFGMSGEEVVAALKADGVEIDSDRTKNGARQIRGKRKGELANNKLIYVIPEHNDKLALVIEFYDDIGLHGQVLAHLRAELGDDLGAEIADMTIAQAGDKFPPGLKELTLWALTVGDTNLLVRLMRFDTYLAVERFDAKLMNQ